MRSASGPYHLNVIDSCFDCITRGDGMLCQLPQNALNDLNAIRQNSFFPRGAFLFAEGESPRGVFILCSGQAKLTATSPDGQSVTLGVAERGEVLGLSNLLSNSPYLVSAETLVPCQVSTISRLPFLQFMRAHTEAALRVARHLSMEVNRAWEQTLLITLAPSAQSKLARFLLSRAAEQHSALDAGAPVALNMTHEEIASRIGARRETVSRALADFCQQEVLRLNRGHIFILQPEKLKALAAH
jgi:CRP/FNR family cyclic AMP-dependent transcriptional regulator